MNDHPENPTLIVGLGAFGRRLSQNVAPDRGAPIENLVRVDAADGEPIADVVGRAKERARALLELGHFVATTRPTDKRGPRFDVLVLGDLGDPGVAEAVGPFTAAIGAELRAEFHPILRAGEGALIVCPFLSAPRAADRARKVAALQSLARLAADADIGKRPGGRIYVIEDQSGKYLLSREELERGFAAFLHLLLFSRLRSDEGGIRHLIERGAGSERGGPFATFACATLEFDQATFARLCAVRLARELLRLFRSGDDPSIAEIAAGAAPIVPERQRLEEELWRESDTGSLVKHLEPPAISVPEIDLSDSPEDIVEGKVGALWRASVARRIEGFRDDVERFKMDRLAAGIERNGKATLERALADLAKQIDRDVAVGPRGHARALEFLRDAHTRAKGLLDEVCAEIESPDLQPFPGSPLDSGVTAVVEAAFARPRPYRMKVFGAIAGVLGACLTAGVILGLYRLLLAPSPSFFDPTEHVPDDWKRAFVVWPMPFVIGAVLSASSTYYRLWKHRKRHHNWVVEARDDLDQALKRYLCGDIVSYFGRRLHYTRLLWIQRIYKRLVLRIEEAIARLEATRAALAEADERLAEQEIALDDRLDASASRGGILFRGLLAPADARSIYHELKPSELHRVAERFLKAALEGTGEDLGPLRIKGRPWIEAPFADPEALLVFCEKELSHAAEICPFQVASTAPRGGPQGESGGTEPPGLRRPVLERIASDGLRAFLRQLSLKLSPPLEVVETLAIGTPPPSRMAVIPPEARALVEATLGEENIGGGWDIRSLSGDTHRVHLVIDRGELPLEALAVMVGASSK